MTGKYGQKCQEKMDESSRKRWKKMTGKCR